MPMRRRVRLAIALVIVLLAAEGAAAGGRPAVQIVATGFRPWSGRFVVDGSFPVRLRAALTPE